LPQLSEILEKRKAKKFTKKSYRPWDLTGDNHPVSEQPLPRKIAVKTDNTPPLKEQATTYREAKEKGSAVVKTTDEATQPLHSIIDNKIGTLLDNRIDNNSVTIRQQFGNN